MIAKMRYLTPLLFLLYLAPASAQNLPQDAISTYFSEYVDDPDFTVAYVSGKVFGLIKDANLDLQEMDEKEVEAILRVVRDVRGIRLLHTDRNAQRHWKEARRRIPTDQYELLFKVRTQDGENVEAFVRDDAAVISEFFLLVGGEDTFAMFSFVGSIDLTQLAELQRALED